MKNDRVEGDVRQSNPLHDQVATLHATIASLQQQVDELKSQRASAQRSEDAAAIITPAPERANNEPSTDPQDESRIFFQLESGFAAQTIDRGWSDNARQRIETALNDEQTNVLNIDSVDCRSSVCKLELAGMNSESEDAFRGPFREQISDVFGAGMVRRDESGKTIVYLAKDAGTLQSMLSPVQ